MDHQEVLGRLCALAGPSGFEGTVAREAARLLEPLVDRVQVDRMGSVVGVHEVHICTANQTLTLRHEAGNRGMLAEGAVDAGRFVAGKPVGLYNMENLLG